MARKLVVEIVGDASSLERTFAGASAASKRFSHELTATVRGSVSATGVFKGLGRSLAFAGGGYIAAASVTEFIRSSVDAARDAGVAQRSLAAQVKASGQSYAGARDAIDKASVSLEKFGFTSEDSQHALTVLERGTGRISRAIQLQGVAANLARAKNIDLASAANVLAKVFGHQETALRRAVPGLDKTAHGMDLIRQAAAKLAGQARANTTEAQRFAATLHNTEVIIGTALLPTVNRFLTRFGDWLDKMNRTGRLQRDVNSALKTASGIFATLKTIVGVVADAFKAFAGAVGGTTNALKLLAGAFVVLKARTKLIEWGLISTSIAKIGTNAEASTGKVGGLAGALGRLKGIGAISIPLYVIASLVPGKTGKNLQGAAGAALLGGLLFGPEGAAAAAAAYEGYQGVKAVGGMPRGAIVGSRDPYDTRPDTSGRVPTVHYNIPGGPDVGLQQVGAGGRVTRVTIPSGVKGAGSVTLPLTAAQRLALGLAQNPNDVALLTQKIAFDRRQIAFLDQLHKRGTLSTAKWVAEVTNFYDDVNSTQATITSITDQAAAKTKTARDRAAAAAKRAAAAAAAALAKNQREAEAVARDYLGRFAKTTTLGVSLRPGYQTPLALQLDFARAEATKSTSATRAALRAMRKAAEKALASGRLSTQAQIDAYNAITDANNQLARAAGSTTKAIRFRSVSVSRAIAELGLRADRATERRVAEFLATLGPGGKAPPGTQASPLRAGGITIQGDLNVSANDPQRLAKEVARQAKRSTVRRGSHGAAP